MARNLTNARAAKAVEWAKRHFRLHSWVITMVYSDEMPDWADGLEKSHNGHLGSCQMRCDDASADVWVSPLACDRAGRDRLTVLMHEMAHVFLMARGHDTDDEFSADRIGELAAFAFSNGMKPWR